MVNSESISSRVDKDPGLFVTNGYARNSLKKKSLKHPTHFIRNDLVLLASSLFLA